MAQPQAVTEAQELPPGLPQVGEVVADKYRIGRMIGRGGTGVVFQATHIVTGKQLALKWLLTGKDLSSEDIERFIREARAAARVSHPNIVDIYDVGEHGGSFYLVMEYLRGRSMEVWLQEHGPLAPGPLLRALLPALRGVHAAHKGGVVHRDLKPENLFLCCDADGEPLETKVLDFGISKIGGVTSTLPPITHSGAVMGTPYYMSPEQAEDSSSVDPRTDIYACGVILYEALAGILPYRDENLTTLLLQIARGDAVPLRTLQPSLPPALERTVMRAMARVPEHRFQDMRALIEALEPFAVDDRRATEPVRAAKSRRPLALAIGAAALLLVLAVVALRFGGAAQSSAAVPAVAPAPRSAPEAHVERTAAAAPAAPKVVALPEAVMPPQPAPAPEHPAETETETETEVEARAPAAPPVRPRAARTAARTAERPGSPEVAAPPAKPRSPLMPFDAVTAPRSPPPAGKGRLGVAMRSDQF